MENIFIKISSETPYFPEVNFNYNTGVCELIGESYMEETYKFYSPIIEWLNDYIKHQKSIVFNFKLTYFNTSTSRIILDILDILRVYLNDGGQVEINWYYKEDDPDMIYEVEDFQNETDVKINLIPFKN
jgi:hypothetical protein